MRSTAIVSAVACAALLVASLGVGALVHWAQRASGASSSGIAERAFFEDPSSVNVGVTQLVQFVIVANTSLPITWVAYDAGHAFRRGIAQGAVGSNVVVTLPTATLRHGSWLTIAVSGIKSPLKAWVT